MNDLKFLKNYTKFLLILSIVTSIKYKGENLW